MAGKNLKQVEENFKSNESLKKFIYNVNVIYNVIVMDGKMAYENLKKMEENFK